MTLFGFRNFCCYISILFLENTIVSGRPCIQAIISFLWYPRNTGTLYSGQLIGRVYQTLTLMNRLLRVAFISLCISRDDISFDYKVLFFSH